MSIKILSVDEIKQKTNSYDVPPILFANPKNLYQRRAKRLRSLAENHPLANYLLFAADLVESQLAVLENQPLAPQENLQNLAEIQPLDAKTFKRDDIWLTYLTAILAEIKPKANDQILATIELLEKSAKSELEAMATALLSEEFNLVSADKAVFIWAALSLYWVQLTQQIPHNCRVEDYDNLQHCPVCGSAPVASIVQIGTSQGLRNVHCSLCESEWNLVRAQCTNCNNQKNIEMWSLDEKLAVVRAESCHECESYLKIMFQEKDPYVEPVADDLASLFLDIELEEKGLFRSGLNPLMFPATES